MKTMLVAVLAAGVAIGVAPPAAAAESDYLNQLAPRLTFLSNEQLLTEGYKVCRYVSVGRPTADAIPMVMKDLETSVSAALDIISAAVQQLRC
jgi:Flp pilus assembly protein TadB